LAGVLENTIEAVDTPDESLLAWLGPAIGTAAGRLMFIASRACA
jgi:copper oxidase (laccase) domain-containing protein